MKIPEINDTKEVWVAWTNTDLTEGRGRDFPLAVCETQATAIRLGKGESVQGSNCSIYKQNIVRIDGQWLMPGRITEPTKDDIRQQKRIDLKKAAAEKAKTLGLSSEDIKHLSLLVDG